MFAVLFFKSLRIDRGQSAAYRYAAFAATATGLLYSLFAPGLITFANALALIGIYSFSIATDRLQKSWMPMWIWRLLGVVLAIVGMAWVATGFTNSPLHSHARLDAAEQGYAAAIQSSAKDAARMHAATLIELQPLNYRAHQSLASAHLLSPIDPPSAVAAFRRARLVGRDRSEVFFEEGKRLLPFQFDLALQAWGYALKAAYGDHAQVAKAIVEVMIEANRPLAGLAPIAELHPALLEDYLLRIRGADLDRAIDKHLKGDSGFQVFDGAQRRRILGNWVLNGKARAKVDAYFAGRRTDNVSDWFINALALRSTSTEAATQLLLEHLNPFKVVKSAYLEPEALQGLSALTDLELERLQREVRLDPTDGYARTRLLVALDRLGRSEAMLAITERLAQESIDDRAFYLWRGRALFELGRFDEAYDSFMTHQVLADEQLRLIGIEPKLLSNESEALRVRRLSTN